jgi:dUTP pyrophosphatase
MTSISVVYLDHYDRAWGDLRYARTGDAAFDLRAAIRAPLTIQPGSRVALPTGVRFGIPAGHELQIRSRSGLALQRGLMVLNSPGTVDEGFVGEVQVILMNLSNSAQNVDPGDRIAQAVLAPVLRAAFVEVADLADTERGSRGFGSTGTL